MEAEANQAISATAALAGLCYGLGILALLWVFRRSIMRQRRLKKESPVPGRQRQHGVVARSEIEGIEGRYWLSRYRQAQKFARLAPPSDPQQRFLAAVSAVQQRRRQG